MNIDQDTVTIAKLVEGYSARGENGVVGLGGRLDIRPPYQREFVYKPRQRDDVIRSVLAGFPLNVMYWAVKPDDTYEVLDGQQRTLSICQYVNGDFSLDDLYFTNQAADIQQRILDYTLTVYRCDGEPSEKQAWFRIVNIAGAVLTPQELRNAVYPGPWLADAKRHFSRTGCAAQGLADAYVKGNPIRQELLETALRWASAGAIEDYMGRHQHRPDAGALWDHFQRVIAWVKTTFPKQRAIMREVDWGPVHAAHHADPLDPHQLEADITQLLNLKQPGLQAVIRKPAGIYRYVLDGNEQHLNLRLFDKAQKMAVYEQQGRKCATCGAEVDFVKMEGDHITPWKDGGLTTNENLQMLCRPCNRRKGAR